MKERPILFSAPMVRAILDGRKTQTRRIAVKTSQPRSVYVTDFDFKELKIEIENKHSGHRYWKQCPYGIPGDRLWVRETWRYTASSLEESRAITEDISSGIAVDWRATYIDNCMKHLGFSREDAEIADDFETWRPSIHMPRWASRILLEITGVRVERLADISEEDAAAEGIYNDGDVIPFNGPWFVEPHDTRGYSTASDCYCALWEKINGAGSWMTNPWVWVVQFKQLKGDAA